MQKELTLDQIQDFKGKYPKQLWYLFFSEMWERFCFYGMRGMLVIFMVDKVVGLHMKDDVANLQYGATQAFVYAFTFIGGLFADKILGLRKSLFWGGFLMIVGSCILAVNPHDYFFLGIGFTIIGTGFFKPNISTMVGSLSLLTFLFTQRSLGPIGLTPLVKVANGKSKRWYEYAVYIGSLCVIPLVMLMVAKTEYTDIFMYIIGPCSLLYLFYEMRNFSLAENKKLAAALVFIIFSIFFWAFFEQSGGSLSLFAANNLNDTVCGIKLDPNGVNNSSNSFFVIIFAALVGMVWLWLNKRKIEPNTLVKFGLGFLFLAAGFYVFYFTKFFADANGRTSLNVFTFGWFVITFGELCLSPIGMSVMTKLSPQKTQAVIMGMWFLVSAYGQYFAGLLGAGMSTANENATLTEKLIAYTDGYKQLAIYALIAGILMIVISPFVRKLMQEVK